jgi:beta-lactam-binding protein with PASTA domain
MPDVTNQNVTAAEHSLQHKGLKTTVTSDKTATSTPNTQVLRTLPVAGTTVKKGDTVKLITGAQGPPVQVPNLVTQSVTAAKAQLQQLGLQANEQFSSTCTQQNIVCMQNPKSGQTILPGGTVSIFTQPTTTAVPDVVGLDQTTACNRLGQAGFQCGTITSQPSSTVAKNNVISTNPVAGAQEPANANVNLVVSSGPSSVLVPYVVGDTQSAAVSALQGAGLSAVVICQPTIDPSQDGMVQSQTPNGGVSVSPAATVTITVTNLSGCSGTTTSTTGAPGTPNAARFPVSRGSSSGGGDRRR